MVDLLTNSIFCTKPCLDSSARLIFLSSEGKGSSLLKPCIVPGLDEAAASVPLKPDTWAEEMAQG